MVAKVAAAALIGGDRYLCANPTIMRPSPLEPSFTQFFDLRIAPKENPDDVVPAFANADCRRVGSPQARPQGEGSPSDTFPLARNATRGAASVDNADPLSISASAPNLAAGAMEVFTATAATNPPDGNNVPTGGTVTFSNGPPRSGTASLVNGLASFSLPLGPGNLLGNGVLFRNRDVCK